MTASLADKKVAIIVANGFDESHVTAIQKALSKAKTTHKIIAPEQGLVNGWQGNGWGHYFTVDAQINTALGSDFDALVIVGGERGVARLKTNLHTRRIVNHFLEAHKPISVVGAGVALLALSARSAGLEVAAPAEILEEIRAAGMTVVSVSQNIDGSILTADGTDIEVWAETTLRILEESLEIGQAAA